MSQNSSARHTICGIAESTHVEDDGCKGVEMKSALRIVTTILMFAGVAIFLVPYFEGRVRGHAHIMLIGAVLAIGCGLLRCSLIEDDRDDADDTLENGHDY